jgi:hypothetical protein
MSQLAFSRSFLPSVIDYSGDVLFNNLTGAALNFDIELGTTLSRFRILNTGGGSLFSVNNSGDYAYSQTNQKFTADTADASDTKGIFLCGGGNNLPNRGAYVGVYGNEYSGDNGTLLLYAGDAASAAIYIRAPSAVNPAIVFQLTSTTVLRLEPGFVFVNPVAGNESTAAGVPLLGSNCPATTLSAPFKWFKVKTQDGSTAYIPAWK